MEFICIRKRDWRRAIVLPPSILLERWVQSMQLSKGLVPGDAVMLCSAID